MAVYVDDPVWAFGRMKMCHMFADSREELDAMADQIGVARKWIQYPGTHREHYDIAKGKRALAVKAGAIELDLHGVGELINRRQAAFLAAAPAARRTGLALSIMQPWAWLIVHGHKPVENRTWPTKVRGLVGIHAGQKFDREGYEWVRATFPELELPAPAEFPRGGIVGRAALVDCVSEHPSPWFFGPFGFVVAEPEPLELIPCPGRLGFFRPEVTR